MTAFEVYALFGAPLLLLLAALAVIWLTHLEDERDRRQSTAAE